MNGVRLLVMMAAICFAGAAEAQIVWSMSANNCVATDASIRADRYKTNLASVQHAATKTGVIALDCPITAFNTDDATQWQIGMNYRDSTGTATTATVRARLYAMSFNGTAPTLLAAVQSNAAPNVTTDTVRTSGVFSHTFTLGALSYWIRIELDRDAANQIVNVKTVFLRFAPVI